MLRPTVDHPLAEGESPLRGREYLDGATAVVRGALDAGADFFAGHPIGPPSALLTQALRGLPTRGGVAIEAEDETESFNLCVKAALSGARAFTLTTGAGRSPRYRNIELATAAEVPLVVIHLQRIGPLVDGATTPREEGASGASPVITLCPSSVAECRTITMRAFDLAERFLCPVVVTIDEELALAARYVAGTDLREWVPVRRRRRGASSLPDRRPYHLSPRDLPPERRMAARSEDTAVVTEDLQVGARTLLVSYGVSSAAMREAVAVRRRRGGRVSALTIHTLWPVPEAAIVRALGGVVRVVVVERTPGEYRREIERVAGGRAEVVGVSLTEGFVTPARVLEAMG